MILRFPIGQIRVPTSICLTVMLWLPFNLHAEPTDGKAIYLKTCYVCHGDDGSGNMPGVSDLSKNTRLFIEPEITLIARIKNGIPGSSGVSMPPKGGNPDLSDEQLKSVLHYIKQMVKQELRP